MNKVTIYPKDDETTSDQIGRSAKPTTLVTRNTARLLALGAIAGPILFTLAWFILGFVSPGFTMWDIVVEPYSPISQPISGLGLGLTAPFMNVAFILGGLLMITGAVGIFQGILEMGSIARWSSTLLLALTGLGMVIDGIFTLESIMVHTAGFMLGNGTPVLSFLVIGLLLRRIPRWRQFGSWLLVGSPLTLVLLGLFFATNDPVAAGAGLGVNGLVQRILVTEVLAWFVAMGWKAFRSTPAHKTVD
jgi:hypothetical protein